MFIAGLCSEIQKISNYQSFTKLENYSNKITHFYEHKNMQNSILPTHSFVSFQLVVYHSIPQCTIVTLQHTVVHCSTAQYSSPECTRVDHNGPKCTKVYYSILQFTTVYHILPQWTTVYYRVLKCTTVYQSVPGCTRVDHGVLNVLKSTKVYYSLLKSSTVYQSVPQ